MTLPISRRRFLAAAGVGIAGMAGGAGYAFGFEAHHVTLTRHDVPVAGLPAALNGLRILQISDVHLYDGIHLPARKVMALAAETAPDITLLTGDLIEREHQLGNLTSFAQVVRGRLATLAVIGNWEYFAGVTPARFARALEAGGAELLFNSNRTVAVGRDGGGLTVVGLDDPRAGHADPDRALNGLPSGGPALWTYHAPGFTEGLSTDRYPRPTFIAAGHTHGGQIRIPMLPPVTPPGSGRFVAGWYRDTFAPLYVSRGVGTTGIRARVLCAPEVPLFTLRRS